MSAKAIRAWIDERTVSFPADKFRLLRKATEESLSKVKIEAHGKALRWGDLDEDLTIEGILAGRWQS